MGSYDSAIPRLVGAVNFGVHEEGMGVGGGGVGVSKHAFQLQLIHSNLRIATIVLDEPPASFRELLTFRLIIRETSRNNRSGRYNWHFIYIKKGKVNQTSVKFLMIVLGNVFAQLSLNPVVILLCATYTAFALA